MTIKQIYFNDFVNYGGHCALTIAMPYCDFKCGKNLCQNSPLTKMPNIEVSNKRIIDLFLQSELMDAIIFQGLEPLDSFDEIYSFIKEFRGVCSKTPIVIYTGYTEEEAAPHIHLLSHYAPLVIKYGRYIPEEEPHYDPILNCDLASDNQYAVFINE